MNQELQEFLSGFRSLWGAVTAAACAGPLALQVTAPQFVSPWPEAKVVTGLTMIWCAIALLLAYAVFARAACKQAAAAEGQSAPLRFAIGALVAAALCLTLYLACRSTFLLSEDQPAARGAGMSTLIVLRGYERVDALKASPAGKDVQLWSDFRYDETQVWTASSLAVVRLSSLFLYAGFFCGVTFAVALLMAGKSGAPAGRAKARTPRAPTAP